MGATRGCPDSEKERESTIAIEKRWGRYGDGLHCRCELFETVFNAWDERLTLKGTPGAPVLRGRVAQGGKVVLRKWWAGNQENQGDLL